MSNLNRGIVVAILVAIAAEIVLLFGWYGGFTLAWLPAPPKRGAPFQVDAASALVLIAAVSVGIERVIEYFWTAIDMTAGSFWPLSAISKHMKGLTDELGATIKPLVVQGTAAASFLKEKGTLRDEDATRLAALLASTDQQLAVLRQSATGSQRLTSYAAAASDAINSINTQITGVVEAASGKLTPAEKVALAAEVIAADRVIEARRENPEKRKGEGLDAWAKGQGAEAARAWKDSLSGKSEADQTTLALAVLNGTSFGQLRHASEVAGVALAGVSDFLATFKTNPGRRLLSIQLGVLGGFAVAGLFGLDVLAGAQNASMEPPVAADLQPATLGGILLTGLVMGLGSSPTHELISFLTKSKEKRKSDAAPDGGLDGGVQVQGGFRPLAIRSLGSAEMVTPDDAATPFDPPMLVRFR